MQLVELLSDILNHLSGTLVYFICTLKYGKYVLLNKQLMFTKIYLNVISMYFSVIYLWQ